MDWIETAKRIYQKRGYLVIAAVIPRRIGHVVTVVNLPNQFSVELPQPFRVVSETDLADYRAQHELGDARLGKTEHLHHFYRIMTD